MKPHKRPVRTVPHAGDSGVPISSLLNRLWSPLKAGWCASRTVHPLDAVAFASALSRNASCFARSAGVLCKGSKSGLIWIRIRSRELRHKVGEGSDGSESGPGKFNVRVK